MRWLFYGVMRFLALWPLRALRVLGHVLGVLLWIFAGSRRHICLLYTSDAADE